MGNVPASPQIAFPPVYLDGWARLSHQKPFEVSEAEWRLALDDGGRFLDAWGSEAAELRARAVRSIPRVENPEPENA